MRRTKILLLILGVIIILLTSCKDENNPVQTPTTGTIQGKVTNSTGDSLIAGATVTTSPPTSSVTTNATGEYTISNVSPGQYSVTAMKGGYNSSTVSISVTAGKTTTANIPLNLSTISMGLIAYYPFNGNANDESGNGHNGTINGAIMAKDRFDNDNKAYSFDGSNDYIEITKNILNLGWNEYTISGWFCRSLINNQQPFQSIFGTIPHVGLSIGLNRPNEGGKVCWWMSLHPGTSWDVSRAGSYNNYQVNNWYHFIFLKQNSTYKLYVNGSIDDTYTSSSSAVNFLAGYRFGYSGGGSPWECFNGKLDDYRIYNRVLTDNEIQSLYHEGGWQ